MQQQQQYHHRQTPPSPSAEAYARREERRNTSPQRRNESLTELLLAAFRVAMQDRRNVVIVVMSALVLALALRGGGIAVGGPQDAATFQMGSKNFDTPTVTVTERGSWGTSVSEAEDVATVLSSSTSAIVTAIAPVSVETASFEEPLPSPSPSSSSSSTSYSSSAAAATTEESMVEEAHQSSSEDPCSSEVDEAAMVNEPETVVSERIVRVVETVTEKMVETATVTETQIVQTVQTATVEAEIEAEIEAEVEAEVEAQEEEAKEELAEEQLIEQDAVDVNVDDFTTRQLIDGQHFDELEELEEKLVEGTEEVGEPFMEVVAGATVEGAETDVMEEL